MLVGYKIAIKMSPTRNIEQNLVSNILDKISTDYVDQINREKLENLAINEILGKLDPFSSYIPPADLGNINEHMTGSFQGIGLEYVPVGDSPMVVRTIVGGGAEKAGILPGDRLIKADSNSLIGLRDIGKFVKGAAGTEVLITLVRRVAGKLQRLNFAVTRGIVPIHSSHIAYAIRPQIGYIKLDRFSATSHAELCQYLQNLARQGTRKLILDLRNNGGGVLEAALEIAGEFLPKNKLILYTEDGKHQRRKNYHNPKDGLFKDWDLVVLMNRYSASASEVVAGSLQDWDRAEIIGENSFGKGLVQEQYDLPNHGALRLTIARYYTPLGRCIQKDYLNKHFKTQVFNYDTTMFKVDTFTTPKGKRVFSSGGIRPDIQVLQHFFVDISAKDTADFLKVIGDKNFRPKLLRNFAQNYSNWHKQYSSAKQFWQQFSVPEELQNQIMSVLKKPQSSSLRNSVEHKLKLEFLALLFLEQEYLPILLDKDKSISVSLDYLSKKNK